MESPYRNRQEREVNAWWNSLKAHEKISAMCLIMKGPEDEFTLVTVANITYDNMSYSDKCLLRSEYEELPF